MAHFFRLNRLKVSQTDPKLSQINSPETGDIFMEFQLLSKLIYKEIINKIWYKLAQMLLMSWMPDDNQSVVYLRSRSVPLGWSPILNVNSTLVTIRDSEWEILKPLIPKSKGFGHPIEVDFREIFNGIFYVQRTGCQWEMMPHDWPPYSTVYRYFKK